MFRTQPEGSHGDKKKGGRAKRGGVMERGGPKKREGGGGKETGRTVEALGWVSAFRG